MGHDFPEGSFLRLADAVTDSLVEVPDDEELAKRLKEADRLIPPSIWLKLRKAFTVKGLPFFQFYIELNRIRLGGPVPVGLKALYKRAADRVSMVRSPVDKRTISPAMTNHIALTRPLIGRVLGALEQGRVDDPIQWAKLNAVMVPLLVDIAKDKGVYMKPTRQMGRERWATFRKMSPKQERVEKLRDDDPESFALMEQLGQTLKQIDGNIALRIEAAGQEVKKGFLAGRPVLIGVDPATGEEMVYDRDGEVVPKGDFFAKVQAKTAEQARLVRVPSRTVVPPQELRMLGDEYLDQLTGDLTWDAITDDKAKQGKLTRLFPTKRMQRFISDPETGETRVEEYKVVVEGRYKGIFLDDLVNSEGRLIEGTVYTYDVKKGRESKFPSVIDPSEREPFVTVADVITKRQFQGKKIKVKTKKLYIKIDGTRQSKVLRNALKDLACNAGTMRGCIPSISYEAVKGSRAAGFYFDPKDFGVIMDSLQGMSLSKAALAEVKGYYKDLARAEAATKNLDAYEPEALASENDAGEKFQFITGSRDKNGEWEPFSLREKQKEALAWMDANGNSGVCALETGVGKTAVSIAMMLKLVRDGLAEPDATYTRPDGVDVTTNGRFLFVCPTSLRGNIKKEVRAMLSDNKVMLDRLDVLSYGQFSGASKTGTVPKQLKAIPFWKERIGPKGKRAGLSKDGKAYKSKKAWDPALYAALIFDEAQAMKNPDSQRSQWALKLHHPRKICLTASPMERNPMEAYVLAAITNNTPLFGRSIEAKNNRKEMRRFKERFCEVVGGRIVGIKQDPLVQRDLHTFIKRNVFHADKTEVKEYNLPKPTMTATPVEMPPMIESMYRDVTAQFAVIMEGAARKFRERKKTDNYGDKQAERIFSNALKPVIRLLTDMANRPAKAMRDVAFAIENGYLPDFVTPIKPDGSGGEPRPLPKAFMGLLRQWQEAFTPGDIEAMADTIGNPKIESAEATIAAKLERAKGSRALIFADDRELCLEAGMHMAKTMAGTHVVALNDAIHFFRAGSELDQLVYPLDMALLDKLVKDPEERKAIKAKTNGLSVHKLPFGKKALRMHPALPAVRGTHDVYLADDWQQFVLKEIVNPNSSIATCTLLGKTYMYGHNLQSFNTVIHLDRDSWNSESMKQRTARAWRQGQDQVVDEVTLDFTYAGDKEGVPTNPNDQTLDQIRKSFQEMDGAIFDSIIKDAQGIELGAEWEGVKKRDASLWRLDEKVVDLMLSPMLERV